jgi:hypothetical protein
MLCTSFFVEACAELDSVFLSRKKDNNNNNKGLIVTIVKPYFTYSFKEMIK